MRFPINRLPAAMAALCVLVGGLPARAEIPQVRHVVVIIQENRSPDNLFHGLQAYLPGVDIADNGKTLRGQTIPLAPIPLSIAYDMRHTHLSFERMYNGGRMDGAARIDCVSGKTRCPPNPAFAYVDPADVAPYFFIAENYGFANKMFQSNQGPSFPAHQFLFGGTSQITATSTLFAENNPADPKVNNGCDAPPSKRVATIGPGGVKGSTFPCFEHSSLTDLLNHPPPNARQGLTWRYYAPFLGSIWNAPEALRHICRPRGKPPACTGPDWTNGNIVFNPAQVITDVQSSQLASVSWVIPTGAESDHANINDGSGPSWVASVVNAIGNSHYWAHTVILITWDDWGGWYDHVKPPIDPTYGYYENGFRVPLLVVSPYTPKGYISKPTHTFGSILKFIESAYGLPAIPPGTFVDSRADDLADFFNFKQAPRPFTTIPAPMSADFFLHDNRPKTPPDDD